MIVSPRSSHASGMDVIGHDVVVVGEGFLADGALSALLEQVTGVKVLFFVLPS